MSKNNLFRKEALEEQQVKWLGGIVLIRPWSFTLVTIIGITFACIILSFLFLGSYTKRSTVTGQVIPSSGVIRVYAPETGIVLEKHVKDGQVVEKGSPLFLLSTLRFDEHGDLNKSLMQTIESRGNTLDDEKIKTRAIHMNAIEQLKAQEQSASADLNKVKQVIVEQKKRIELAQSNVERYRALLEQEYISVDEFQARQDNFIGQQQALQNYERDAINKRNELINIELQLSSLNDKQRNEILSLDRQISSVQQEKIQNQSQRNFVILAQATGIATAVNAELGQQIVSNTPVVNIIPQGTQLEAHLYVPSQSIGFIHVGQQVKLRYRSFPYQKFGQGTGHVISIADTAMKAGEIVNLGEFSTDPTQENQAIYLVKVTLSQQDVKAYGQYYPLKMGMALEADIMQENRKLYEWVLEPLMSITGKI